MLKVNKSSFMNRKMYTFRYIRTFRSAMTKGNPKTGEKINRIKEVLEEQGRTQRWLAKELDKAPGTVANLCNNLTQPHLSDLKIIANLLKVDIRELLYSSIEKK